MPYGPGEWPEYTDYSGDFPEDFAWGMGTAAYQIEGAYKEDGRGATIWDTHTGADTIGMPGADCSYCCPNSTCKPSEFMNPLARGSTGNIACDHYHLFEADIQFMKSQGLKHYRFSIAWSRIYPTGKRADGVNQKGIDWYNRFIDALVRADITPWVTLYHWDLPQGLLSPPEMQGWWSVDDDGHPNGQILDEFLAFANTCFSEFGDRVKYWLTFNEPWSSTVLGGGWGHAPSLDEYSDMTVWPYIAGHNILIAHAKAVELYRKTYQPRQKGKIGMSNNQDWPEPKSNCTKDVAAAERQLLFMLGWFSHPVFFGDYPEVMRKMYGTRLPNFTNAEQKLLKGSVDFFGLNQYGGGWVEYNPEEPGFDWSYAKGSDDGFKHAESGWLKAKGWGLSKLLHWIDRTYNHPPIYVFEGGWSTDADTVQEAVNDYDRAEYYANRTVEMSKVIENGVDLRGYFAWSLYDNFEWASGYLERFGTSWTEFNFGDDPDSPEGPGLKPTAGKQWRQRKDSSCWLEEVRTHGKVVAPDRVQCVTVDVFGGQFLDQSDCLHHIAVKDITNGTASAVMTVIPPTTSDTSVCNSAGSSSAKLSGGTIVADFSGTQVFQGANFFVGYWNRMSNAINWQDGSVWRANTR